MCFAVVCKDVFYFIVYLHAVFAACFCHYIDAAERFDGASQQFICLQAYDKFVLLIYIACFVGSDGRYCCMI